MSGYSSYTILEMKLKQNTCYEKLPSHIQKCPKMKKKRCCRLSWSTAPLFLFLFLRHHAVWPGNTPHTQLQLSIPIIATGPWWFRAGQAPAPQDNAHDYICAHSMGPMEGRVRTPGQQRPILGFVWRTRMCLIGAVQCYEMCTKCFGGILIFSHLSNFTLEHSSQ